MATKKKPSRRKASVKKTVESEIETVEEVTESPSFGTYKLLAGCHSESQPTSEGNGPVKMYRQGDVIKSPTDLVKKFGKDKFERV